MVVNLIEQPSWRLSITSFTSIYLAGNLRSRLLFQIGLLVFGSDLVMKPSWAYLFPQASSSGTPTPDSTLIMGHQAKYQVL